MPFHALCVRKVYCLQHSHLNSVTTIHVPAQYFYEDGTPSHSGTHNAHAHVLYCQFSTSVPRPLSHSLPRRPSISRSGQTTSACVEVAVVTTLCCLLTSCCHGHNAAYALWSACVLSPRVTAGQNARASRSDCVACKNAPQSFKRSCDERE